MSNFCGIDFGTSNSTFGVIVNGKPSLIKLEEDHRTLPSAIFYEAEERYLYYGREALDYFHYGYQGRLMRSFKGILGTDLMHEATVLGLTKYPFMYFVEVFLSRMKRIGELQTKTSIESAVIGQPIRFSDNDDVLNLEAQNMLIDAAKKAGFKNVELQYEPIAAALRYEMKLSSEKLALIVDVGGGTTDISIVCLSPQKAKHKNRNQDCLGTAGVHIGGTDFDRELNILKIMPLVGYGQPTKIGAYMPKHPYKNMTSLNHIPNTYIPRFISLMSQLSKNLTDYSQAKRLERLVTKKLAFDIAIMVEEAKIALSTQNHVSTDLSFLEEALAVSITTQDLISAISEQLNTIDNTIRECLKQAEVSKENLDIVFFTGGSSQMSVLQTFIQKILPGLEIHNTDSLHSVGLGLVLDAEKKFS